LIGWLTVNPGRLLRLLSQFRNVLIYVLLVSGAITALLHHWVDTSVIIGVVFINAVIGFIQEGKAEQALDAIRNLLSTQAIVVRDGKRLLLATEQLVPGDLVFLQAGDKVPADIRLTWAKGLQIQEAALTGESMPVEKNTAPVLANMPLGDRTCMAYSGTLVTYGQGSGLVVATGEHTEIGRISSLLSQVEPLTTPLLRQLASFSRWLTLAILTVAVLTFSFGVLVHGYAASDMFMAAVGLAVAAIPEGLPAIITITLAIGVERMAKRNAIIRRLPAVETLGSVTVVCSDKTGTLTRNEMMVQTLATSQRLFTVSGMGYAPWGNFLLNEVPIVPADHPLIAELTRGALLCSDAGLREVDGNWIVDGDPTEGALLTLAMKAGLDPALESKEYPRTDVIPFESQHRFMATLHHDHEGHGFIYVKGAPERILAMCNHQRGLQGDEPLDLAYWQHCMGTIAAAGQRVLALAVRPATYEQRELHFQDVEGNLSLLSLFGMADPPRQEAIQAVANCQAAGIRVKMITGDHAGTALVIGRQLGLCDTAGVVTGAELDTMNDAELRDLTAAVDIFARTSPEHKLRLVQSLQAQGQVVAMTGDGVNDTPALKRADVGIAMGKQGTEAAKEVAEMVLADDNFASIAHAVEEGRTIYDNIKKAIAFILPTNFGEALIIVAAISLGQLLPITPVQVLWVNMITAVTLALALAFEPAETNVMQRPPRHPQEPLLSGLLV
jgi:magnesium-transporting ATPase (P-type)